MAKVKEHTILQENQPVFVVVEQHTVVVPSQVALDNSLQQTQQRRRERWVSDMQQNRKHSRTLDGQKKKDLQSQIPQMMIHKTP